MRQAQRASLVAGLIGLALTAPGQAGAQTSTGNLRGYVTGPGGAPVGDVQVAARALDNNQTRGVTTNASGFYYIGGLRPTSYEVIVRRVGFTPQTRRVVIQIGQTSDLNVTIAEQAVQLTAVTVQASPEQQTARTSEVGTNISREQIANLPNFERNVLDLAKLVPGVTSTTGDVNSTDKSFAAAGQPASAVNVFIDGASYKSDILPGGVAGQNSSKGNPFPQGAVQEFRVLTQNYKAEYQRASSAIIIANTRSGTNDPFIDAFANGIGYGYAARDAYAFRTGQGKPQYRRLQAGASLGGPIVRDKLFFFGTFEGNYRDDPAYVTLGGNAAQAPAGVNFQQFLGQQQQQFRENLGVVKLTYTPSGASTVDASFNLRDDHDFRDFGGQSSLQNAVNHPIKVYTGILNWRYAGSRWLNEAQFSPQQYLWQQIPKNPNIVGQNYDGILQIGGNQASQKFTQNRFSFRDDLTRAGVQLGGDHVFKLGANFDLLNYKGVKDLAGNPRFTYTSANGYSTPTSVVFGFGDPTIETNNQQFGAYAQDDWTIGRRLTLNLGVRWDVETNPINNQYVTPQPLADSLRGPLASKLVVDQPLPNGTTRQVRVIDQLGGIGRFISSGRSSRPIQWGQVQPRVGASYDLMGDGRTVLFGGGGIYYDRQNWNTFYDEQYRRQYGQYTVQFSNSCTTQVGCTAWNPQFLSNPSSLRSLVGTTGVPEVFLVANDLKPPQTTQASFGVRQAIGPNRLTVSYNGVFGKNITNYVRASPFGGLGPNYLTAFVTDDRVKTRYNSLQVQFEMPMLATSRWGGSLAYTLSKAEEQGNAVDIFWFFDDRYPTVGDLPWRTTPGDQRHNVVANAMVRLKYDFLLSGILQLASPVTVAANNSSAGTGVYQHFTYSYVGTGSPFLGVGHVFSTQNVDLRLQRDFRVAAGQRVGLAIDLFNALAASNWGCYNGDVPAPGNENTNFGLPGCAAPGRRLQIGLRYTFDRGNTTGGAAAGT